MVSKFLDKYDVIIFDCDGVLLDVNVLKCEAFGKVVNKYPHDVIKKFVEYCKNSFGVSRYIKFKLFFSEFANEEFNQAKYNLFLKEYARHCEEIYRTASLTLGCENLLLELYNSEKKLYVASGSDENELKKVFIERNLNEKFVSVFGSPKTKSDCTSIILGGNINKKAVFIGDALSDMKVASEYNIDFVYISNYTVQNQDHKRQCEEGAIKVIKILEDLL